MLDEKTIGTLVLLIGGAAAAFEAWQKGRASSKAEAAAAEAARNPTPIPQMRPGDDVSRTINTLISIINDERQERADDRTRFQGHYQKLTNELNAERNSLITLRDDMVLARKALDTERVERNKLATELGKSNDDIDTLHARLTAVQDELTIAIADNNRLIKDNQRQAADIAELRKVNAQLIEVNAQLRQSNTDLMAANDRLVAVNDEYRDMLAGAGIAVSSINAAVQSQERNPNE